MIRSLVLITTIVISSMLSAQSTKKALFFGNSYTDFNDLPVMVSKLASSLGDSLLAERSTAGGQRLKGHASDPGLMNSLLRNDWDFIVFQEQSQLPSFPIQQVQQDVFPYAKQLCDTLKLLPFCTQPIFFMTWGRENGDQRNCQFYPPLCTYEGMQLELRKNYLKMGQDNDAWVSPVGMVWREVRKRWPGIQLYTPDESHPSIQGSYVAACAFYAIMFGKSPVGAPYVSSLSKADADSIQLAAEQIVFDSLKTWNVIPDSVDVRFNAHVSYDTVTFQNLASGYDSVHWNFGDGMTGSTLNPSHIYGIPDTFLVTFKGYKSCKVDSITKVIITTRPSVSLSADFSYVLNFDSLTCMYTGSKSDSIKWFFGDGSTSDKMNPKHVYASTGTYTVTLKAFYHHLVDSVKKVVTPQLNTTSVNFLPMIQFNEVLIVYPNPSSNFARLKSKEELSKVEVVNSQGKTVLYGRINSKYEALLELNKLKNGIYVVRAHLSDGSLITRSLLRQ
jgi:PKD repeat protein